MPIQKEIYRVAVQSTARDWRSRFERYALVGTRCNKCRKDYYPRRPVCPGCHSRDVADVQLPHKGTVIAYNVNYLATMGFMQELPMARALVQLDGNGPVVFSDVVDCDPDSVEIGMRVEMVVRRIKRESNGNVQYAHKWRPVWAGQEGTTSE